MTDNGETVVAGAGAYAPSARLPTDAIAAFWDGDRARGVDSVAVPAADEDSLTLGAAAGRRALSAAGVDAAAVEHLAFATTTPPVEEPELTPRLGEFLGVPAGASRETHAGGTRAGTAALSATVARAARPALVVAADAPQGEPDSPEGDAAGAAAGAVVVTADGDGATLSAWGRHAEDYPGTRYRRRGETETESLGVTSYDRAAFREPVVAAVSALPGDAAPEGTEAVAVTAPDGSLPARALAATDAAPSPSAITTPVRTLGDTGAAGPLVGLARAFDDDAARTLLVGVGSAGSAAATVVDGTAPTETALDGDRELSYAEATRRRGELAGSPPAGGGAAVSVPTWRQSRAARYRLVAGRCPDCGALRFPPEGACTGCRALVDYERVTLPDRGEIVTVTGVTADGAPPEFVPQATRDGGFPVGIVRFTVDGATVDVPLQVCDADPSDATAGDTVERAIRRVYEQEGVVRYGAKARPVE
ncbi:zinc ribbon domain-containing protein [Halobaculum sp. MBLA0143]|uniref:zinc ribbon domain-containing protein n=1 Tax=Halobaculum sp. MBLA0143 TaxID=3079933 RepID=UPI0035263079